MTTTKFEDKYRDRRFWTRDYIVDTAGGNKNQVADLINLNEYVSTFTGNENKKA